MEVRRLKNNELYHHGIKGQKWGVRRYQNPDGSLTPAGIKRYNRFVKKEVGAVERQLSNLEKDKKYHKKFNKYWDDIEAYEKEGKGTKEKYYKNLEKAYSLESNHANSEYIAKKELSVLKNYKLSDYMREKDDLRRRNKKQVINALTIIGIAYIPREIRQEKTFYRIERSFPGYEGNESSDKARKYLEKHYKYKETNSKKSDKYWKKYKKQNERDKKYYGG